MTKSIKQKKAQKKQPDLPGKKGSLKSGERLILKLPVSKKNQEPRYDYWKEFMKMNAPKTPSVWDVVNEVIIPKNPKDLLGIGFDPEEDMSFLPEIPK